MIQLFLLWRDVLCRSWIRFFIHLLSFHCDLFSLEVFTYSSVSYDVCVCFSWEYGLLILRLWQVATKNDFSHTTNTLTINNVRLTHRRRITKQYELSFNTWQVNECSSEYVQSKLNEFSRSWSRTRIKYFESNKSCWLMLISVYANALSSKWVCAANPTTHY